MYEIVVLGTHINATWKVSTKPSDLSVYMKPDIFMVALYIAGGSGDVTRKFDAILLDYIYAGDTV